MKAAIVVAFVLTVVGITGTVTNSLVTHWGDKPGASFIIMACLGLGYLFAYWDARRRLS